MVRLICGWKNIKYGLLINQKLKTLTKEIPSEKPFVLVKYPSRGRPDRFFSGLNSIYNNLYDFENFGVLVTADIDDKSMCNDDVRDRIAAYKNAKVIYGTSKSKVDAINRDMDILPEQFKKWDILVVMSDDMKFTFFGWDEIIRNEFLDNNLDKLLHFPDNDAKDALAVMYIAGRHFYDRFSYIYHSSYRSLFCDNEVMEVSKMIGAYRYVNCPGLFLHLNPAYGHLPKDEMFIRQQEEGYTIDQQNYIQRKNKNFDL